MSVVALGTSELNELLHLYIPEDLASSEKNGAAFANDVYNLKTTKGAEYVMRVLKLQLPETVEREAALQHRLAKAGIGTPKYLVSNEGGYIGKHGHKVGLLSLVYQKKNELIHSQLWILHKLDKFAFFDLS